VAGRFRADQFFKMRLYEATPVADFVAIFAQSATGVASYNRKLIGPGGAFFAA
jgi:hypothetical protein